MDPRAVYTKSEKGWAEIRHRNLKLDRAARFLLVAADGRKDVETLARQYALNGRIGPLINELVAMGLLERSAAVLPAEPEAAPPSPGSEQDRMARVLQHLRESAPELMGREAERFLSRISPVDGIEQVIALIPDFRAAVAKRHGFSTAEVASRKLLDVIGPLPDDNIIVR
jgi:hypothetical protein